LKPFRHDSILHLVSRLDHRIRLLLGLFALLHKSLEIRIDGVLSAHEIVDLVFFERKSSIDGFLSGPIFSVGLAFDENLPFSQNHDIGDVCKQALLFCCRYRHTT
jgi:hypothetical protein